MNSPQEIDFSKLGHASERYMFPALSRITSASFKAGTLIYSEGSRFNGVYFVEGGIAKAEMTLDGESTLTSLALCGDILGIDSFHCKAYASSATCVADLTAVWVPAECFYLLLKTNCGFRSRIEEAIGKAIVESTTMIKLLSRNDADVKVAYLLLKLFLSKTINSKNSECFNVGLSRAEMAEYLGLRMETVSRKLTTFRDLGIIRVKGRRIHIRNLAGLRSICHAFSKLAG